MGKRSAVVELFLGNMGSIQRETRPSMQREDQLTMETKLEQIAAKARREPNLCSPCWPITSRANGCRRICHKFQSARPPEWTARRWRQRRRSLEKWIEPMLDPSTAKDIARRTFGWVYIPKPGKTEKRPLGVPTVSDRALQRSTAEVLSAIYEQDPSSWWRFGTVGRGALTQWRRWKVVCSRCGCGQRSTAWRIVQRAQRRYQALRLTAHRCAAAGLDSGTAPAVLASMPSTPQWIA